MDRRRSLVATFVFAAAIVAGCASTRTAHPIEGTWVVTKASLGGQDLPLNAFDGSTLSLDAGRYAFQNDRGDYVVLPGSKPGALDIHGTDGPNAGRTILAIFALNGDTMTVAYDLSGTVRPTVFESRAGTRQFLVVYRRS